MSVKLREAMKLEYLEEFKLIAGEKGLDRQVTTVGILDHEIVEDLMHIFVEGEFVLATLSIAKNDETLIYKAVKELIAQKAVGLAFKTVYYETLSQEILDYADAHDFPIFTINPDIYLENIINTVFNSIKSKGHHDYIESKLETIYSGIVNTYTIKQIAMELNSNFKTFHKVIYCRENRLISSDESIRLVEKYGRLTQRNIGHSLFKFRNGILFILTYDALDHLKKAVDLPYIMTQLGMDEAQYTLGISRDHLSLDSLDQALKESYYAFQAAELNHTSKEYFDSIGLYQFLIPHLEDPWAKRFSKQLIDPIEAYDQKYKTDLLKTLTLYFDHHCNAKEVSERLFQHKNTVLYRIRKVKELIGTFDSEQSFIEQMSVALKIHKTQNR